MQAVPGEQIGDELKTSHCMSISLDHKR